MWETDSEQVLLAIGLGAVAARGFKIESYNKFLHFSQVGAHSLGAQTSAVTLSEMEQLKAFSQQVEWGSGSMWDVGAKQLCGRRMIVDGRLPNGTVLHQTEHDTV